MRYDEALALIEDPETIRCDADDRVELWEPANGYLWLITGLHDGPADGQDEDYYEVTDFEFPSRTRVQGKIALASAVYRVSLSGLHGQPTTHSRIRDWIDAAFMSDESLASIISEATGAGALFAHNETIDNMDTCYAIAADVADRYGGEYQFGSDYAEVGPDADEGGFVIR